MKAQPGRTYAQIINGRCHWLFTADDLPDWNENDAIAVDVTGAVPSVGDAWDGALFTPYVPSKDEQDRASAKQYAKLRALSELSPAQIQAWIDANVTNLATAQDAIKTMAIGLSILIRRELK